VLLVLAAVLGVFGAGFFYVQAQNRAADQLASQKQQAEERLKTEEEKARLAELKAQEETEARRQIEAEFAAKLLTSETARQQAEAEALAQTAARLANARGSLVIATAPAGATVTVGNLPPKTTPATFSDIKIGSYSINISLPRHEEVELELEVSENATTESGVIPLVALIGSLRINSEPGVADYELQPANVLMVDPVSRRSGQTPAALDDLSPGDYRVTLTREGWAPHTQVVSIARGSTTHLRWSWPNALVKINSTPSGATVTQDGVALGTTPLTLSDQPPGEASYEVTLARFEPLHLVASIESGKTIELAAEFKSEDRLYTVSELDRKPEQLGVKLPELPYYLALEGGRAEIELIVGRDGAPRKLSVVQASNDDLGRFCLSAVEKWQFRPGTKNGNPVNVSLKLPFVFKAAK
jgi:TonB family protein